jgi:hypothetical protein
MNNKIVEAVKNSFESFKPYANDGNTYAVKIQLDEVDFNDLALRLIDVGYSVLLMEEAGKMTLTVYTKFNSQNQLLLNGDDMKHFTMVGNFIQLELEKY